MEKDLTQKVTGLTEERKVYQERCIALEKQLTALRRQVHLCCCLIPSPTCQKPPVLTLGRPAASNTRRS